MKRFIIHPIPVYQVAIVMLFLITGTFIGNKEIGRKTIPVNADVLVSKSTTSQLTSWQESGANIGVLNVEDSLMVMICESVSASRKMRVKP